MDRIAQIKEKVSFLDLVRYYGFTVQRRGRLYSMSCPFHPDKRPSLIIYPHTNSFYCFGCGEGGDIISFASKYFNITTKDAIQKIAQDFNIVFDNKQEGAEVLPGPSRQLTEHEKLKILDEVYTLIKQSPRTVEDLEEPAYVEACHKHEIVKAKLQELETQQPQLYHRNFLNATGIYRESDLSFLSPAVKNFLKREGIIAILPDDIYEKIKNMKPRVNPNTDTCKNEELTIQQEREQLIKELEVESYQKKIKIKNLKKMLNDLNLSLRKFSELSHLSPSTIWRAYKGLFIKEKTFEQIIQALLERRRKMKHDDHKNRTPDPENRTLEYENRTPKNETPQNETLQNRTLESRTPQNRTPQSETLKSNGKSNGKENNGNLNETSNDLPSAITSEETEEYQGLDTKSNTPDRKSNGKNEAFDFVEHPENIDPAYSFHVSSQNLEHQSGNSNIYTNTITEREKNINNILEFKEKENIKNINTITSKKKEKINSVSNPKAYLERALIFKIASNQDLLYLADIFSPDFIEPENRELFKTLLEFKKDVESKRRPFTSVEFQIRLGSKGASEYITEIADSLDWSIEELLELYNVYVAEKKLKTKVIELLERNELNYETLNQLLNSLIMESKVEDKAARIDKLVDSYRENYLNKQEIFETRFKELSFITGGFKKGQYCIIASRPSVGKTTLLLNLALEFAKKGKKVVFFSLEQSSYEIIHRLVNILAKKNVKDEEETEHYLGELCKLNLYIYENVYSVANIEFVLRRFHTDADVVFIDYAQIISLPNRLGNLVQEYSLISNSLRRIAKELNVLLIVASQLNRDVERRADPKPRLSDLRETGAFEQDADIVMLLSKKPQNGFISELVIDVAKNRSGATGECIMKFDMPAFYVYEEVRE